jgi:hypothetical protein
MAKKSVTKKMAKIKKPLAKQNTKKTINSSVPQKESVSRRLTIANKVQLRKKPEWKSKTKTAIVQPISTEPTGRCVMVYMGNTYCKNGITKSECDSMAHTYPGAICTWTKGATCLEPHLSFSKLGKR